MHFFVKNMDDEIEKLGPYENADLIQKLKEAYAKQCSLEWENIRLVCNGNECENEKTIGDCGLKNEDTLAYIF